MNLFVSKANKEIEALKGDKEKLIEASVAQEAEIKQAHKSIEDLTAANAEQAKEIENLKAEIATHKAETQKQVEAAKETAGKKAAEIVASVGIEQGTIKDSTQETTPEQIAAQFEALKGAARAKFYAENKDAILKANGVKR
jgi:CHASE3 domain sensor protein